MQPSSGITALVALAGGAPANAGAQAATAEEGDTSPGQQFAQLLNDSGAHADEQGGQTPARGQLAMLLGANALSAQEIEGKPTDALQDILANPDQVITPQDAGELIQRLDAMIQQAPENVALTQLKEQLQKVVRNGEPVSVAKIIAAVPALHDQKSVKLLASVLAVLKKHVPVEVEVSGTANTATLTLPGTYFRAAVREAQTPAAAAEGKKKKEGDAVATVAKVEATVAPVVVPLVAAALVVPTTTAPTVSAVADQASAVPTISLDQAQAKPLSPADIDAAILRIEANQASIHADGEEAIPALTLSQNTALPEVELPQVAPAAIATAKPANSGLNESLQALAGTVPADKTKSAEAVGASAQKNDLSINSLLTLSHSGGHTPTQTAQAVQPASHLPTHLYNGLNQVPVTDQVHVAIHQAAKDGMDRITIQLDPVDLGRVEVNMQTGKDGQTQIFFMVDKAETFDHLSRDARFLERSLQEAGIKADTGSMQFNLRQQPQPQLHSDLSGQGQQNPQAQPTGEDETEISSIPSVTSMAALTRNYTINIREGVDISA